MAFEPVLMERGALQEWANSPAEFIQLEWDGWVRYGTRPPRGPPLTERFETAFDPEGKLNDSAIPERLQQSKLDAAYVRRGEYVPGEGGDPIAVQTLIDTTLQAHVDHSTPHPAYDDLPSLRLIFENGLV